MNYAASRHLPLAFPKTVPLPHIGYKGSQASKAGWY